MYIIMVLRQFKHISNIMIIININMYYYNVLFYITILKLLIKYIIVLF